MGTILNTPIKDDTFSLEDVQFGINKLANGKDRDIEGYQAEIFKMGKSILIPYLHKLLNLVVKRVFSKLLVQSLIVPIFKNGDKMCSL